MAKVVETEVWELQTVLSHLQSMPLVSASRDLASRVSLELVVRWEPLQMTWVLGLGLLILPHWQRDLLPLLLPLVEQFHLHANQLSLVKERVPETKFNTFIPVFPKWNLPSESGQNHCPK